MKSDQVDELKIVGDTTDYYAENTPEYTMIGVRKVDRDNLDTGLAGAEFNVYSNSSCTDESFVTTLAQRMRLVMHIVAKLAGKRKILAQRNESTSWISIRFRENIWPSDGRSWSYEGDN